MAAIGFLGGRTQAYRGLVQAECLNSLLETYNVAVERRWADSWYCSSGEMGICVVPSLWELFRSTV
jgi:hypothetical protein